MKRLLVIAAALLIASSPAVAVNTYIAFGDSVTRGTGSPAVPSSVFDCVNGCSQFSTPEVCGYVLRLEQQLPGSENVINRGSGGETTAQGVTRIDGVLDGDCGGPGECIATILMHGTNDMNGTVSPETAKANLEMMIDKSESRGIDVLLTSVIRKVFDAGNSKWASYRARIGELANEKAVPLADPYAVLCASNGGSCFNFNYWLLGSSPCNPDPGDPNLGHVNPDGYEVMTPLIKNAIAASPVPGVPSPTAPTGEITDTTPTYTWTAPATAARWYHLQADNGATVNQWHKATNICTGNTCSTTPGVALAAGAHTWRVRGRNLSGFGNFSAVTNFTVVQAPTEAPSLISPTGDVYETLPTYEWSTVTQASSYNLQVEGPTTALLIDEDYDAVDVCAGSTCAVTPATALVEGAHVWRVRASNIAGDGPYSPDSAFDVRVPEAAGPLNPVFDRYGTQPTYKWTVAAGAASYHLQVNGPGGGSVIDEWHDAVDICEGTTCQVTPAVTLAEGDHEWRVRGSSSVGDGPWTAWIDFAILECDPLNQDLPGNPMVNTTFSVGACVMIEAGKQGPYTIVSPGNVTFHAGQVIKLYNGFSVKAGATFTAITDP